MQGFNMGRYYPPDEDSPPKFNKGSSSKGSKINGQTVRFELPFSICCLSCDPEAVIAQGVRFNAQKTKVGYFYSTPIWSFRFKHIDCGAEIEIQTDPENTDYVVSGGGRRQYPPRADEDDQDEGEQGLGISAEEKQRRQEDGFAALEGKKNELERMKEAQKRIDELYHAQDRDWNDSYRANQRVRRLFRAERKVREAKAEDRKRLQDKIGWGGEILDLTREDELRASLVQFGDSRSIEDDITDVTSKPLRMGGDTKVDEGPSHAKHVSKLVRLSVDPFLGPKLFAKPSSDTAIAGVKRKRIHRLDKQTGRPKSPPISGASLDNMGSGGALDIHNGNKESFPVGLVNYRSDEE